MVSFPYHSHIFEDSYGSGMGIVWVRCPIIAGPGKSCWHDKSQAVREMKLSRMKMKKLMTTTRTMITMMRLMALDLCPRCCSSDFSWYKKKVFLRHQSYGTIKSSFHLPTLEEKERSGQGAWLQDLVWLRWPGPGPTSIPNFQKLRDVQCNKHTCVYTYNKYRCIWSNSQWL